MKSAERNVRTEATLRDLFDQIERARANGNAKELGASALLQFVIWPEGTLQYGGFTGPILAKLGLIEMMRLHADRLEGEVHAEINAQDEARMRGLAESMALSQAGSRPS